MFKLLTKEIHNLAVAIDSLVYKLDAVCNVVNTAATSFHTARITQTICGKDPEVQQALNTPDKPQTNRKKWTSKEEELLINCYAKGWKASAIRDFMEREGFKRSEHAIVDHMHDLRKRMK